MTRLCSSMCVQVFSSKFSDHVVIIFSFGVFLCAILDKNINRVTSRSLPTLLLLNLFFLDSLTLPRSFGILSQRFHEETVKEVKFEIFATQLDKCKRKH
jgi:hypothetical protein